MFSQGRVLSGFSGVVERLYKDSAGFYKGLAV